MIRFIAFYLGINHATCTQRDTIDDNQNTPEALELICQKKRVTFIINEEDENYLGDIWKALKDAQDRAAAGLDGQRQAAATGAGATSAAPRPEESQGPSTSSTNAYYTDVLALACRNFTSFTTISA